MARHVTLAGAAAVSILSATLAVAKTPFGGDDTGFIPPDKATAKCETSVSKLSGKLVASFFKCHIKMASASLKLGAPQDDEACETTARTKYNAAVAKLTGCPPCLNPGMLADNATAQLEGLANSALYCGGTTPFGGDDGGNIPPDKATAKCENTGVKLVIKLTGALVKCHLQMVAASIKAGTPQDDESCENAAVAAFNTASASLTNPPCPACLVTLLPLVGSMAVGPVDSMSGDTFCASPSGAFLN